MKMVASSRLNIIVVGAGLGGLSAALCLSQAGHRVHVYEALSELSELGAGIQIPPNAARILDLWGLQEGLLKYATKPTVENLRRFSNGRIVGQQRRNTKETFGYEYAVHPTGCTHLSID